MGRIILFLGILLVGFYAFFIFALNREAIEPFLMDVGIDPDSIWTRGILKAVAIALIGMPVAGLMWSIAALGSTKATVDIHGYIVLRLRSGARYFFSVASIGFAGLFIFVATEESDNIFFNLFMVAFGLAFMFGGVWIFIAKVRYDNSTLFVTEYTGATRRHEWADLEGLEVNDQAQEFHLLFRTGRKARISFYYQGVNDLIRVAEDKLHVYARAS